MFCLSELVVKGYFSSEGGSETESTVDSDFGRGDLLAAASSDSFFSYKPRYSTVQLKGSVLCKIHLVIVHLLHLLPALNRFGNQPCAKSQRGTAKIVFLM